MLKKGLLFCAFILLSFTIYAQTITLASWNLKNLGSSKTQEEIEYIATLARDLDVLVIQEVVTNPSGAQTVAKIADELNRKGAAWDYAISPPTISSPYRAERYAYFWKKSKLTQKKAAWLDTHYIHEIEREPYFLRLHTGDKQFTIVNFHALPSNHQPETEIKYFRHYPAHYPEETLLFCGDFNLSESHTVFNPLKKMGYKPAITNQKTSLKVNCKKSDCLASELDNIFYPAEKVRCLDSGVIHFYEDFETLKEARLLSDHVPVFLKFELL